MSSYDIVARTTAGQVGGLTRSGVHLFRGIPYGAPTGGANRFKPPRPVEPWSGVRDATAFGHNAPQIGHAEMGAGVDADPAAAARMAVFAEFIHGLSGDEPEQGEDCLVLNVWTPSLQPDVSRAVLVWIHGGAFTTGSGSWPLYEGTPLAQRGDCVVVTINHRLDALGFMHLDEIGGAAYAGSGNAGMLDIIASLEWVRDNIANFGGDPSKVMIFGGSGGASKTSAMLAFPAAKGLFHRGAMLSGPYVRARTPEFATMATQKFLAELGLGERDVDRLHELPAQRLLDAAQHLQIPIDAGLASAADPTAFMPMQPVCDGVFMTNHPVDPVGSPHGRDVQMMIGSTRDDMKMMMLGMPWFGVLDDAGLAKMAEASFGPLAPRALAAYRTALPGASPTEIATRFVTDRVMWSGSIDWAERKVAGGGAPVYLYRFDYETTALGGVLGATHGGDIPFAFNNHTYNPMAGDRPGNEAFGRVVSEAFVRFAHTGDPNHDGLPQWRPYQPDDRCTMVLDERSHLEVDPDRELREVYTELRNG
ncbi:MAG: carboxylesterase/lipase family protein [Acidimicrobiia bacterium]